MIDSPAFWASFSLLFLLPFFDPRQPARLLHLDLAAVTMLVAFGSGIDRIDGWILAQWIPLAYLATRLGLAAWHRAPGTTRLIPVIPVRIVEVGAFALMATRVVVNLRQHYVIASGEAGSWGALTILHGQSPYGLSGSDHLDTYGPANYLLYLPFERLAGGTLGDLDLAAHMVAVASDLAVFAALVWLARRLSGPDLRGVAVAAVAWGWAASPFAWNASYFSTNDLLVAAAMVLPFLAAERPVARGSLVAIAAGVKFVALPLAAGFTRFGRREISWRFVAGFMLVALALFVPFLIVDGREFFDRTIGFQLSFRELRPAAVSLTLKAVAAVAVTAFFVAPRRTPIHLAALLGMGVIALQIAVPFWWVLYVVWWLPLAILVLLRPAPPALTTS